MPPGKEYAVAGYVNVFQRSTVGLCESTPLMVRDLVTAVLLPGSGHGLCSRRIRAILRSRLVRCGPPQ